MRTPDSLAELLAQLLAAQQPPPPNPQPQSIPNEVVAVIEQLRAQGYDVRSLECVKLAVDPPDAKPEEPKAPAPETSKPKLGETLDQTWAKFARIFPTEDDADRLLLELMRHCFYAGAAAGLDRVNHTADCDRATLSALLEPLAREVLAFALRA